MCQWCEQQRVQGMKNRFCSGTCAAKYRNSLPHIKEMKSILGKTLGIKLSEANKSPELRARTSKRMKENNPMTNPIALAKMKNSMKGRTFLSRGGNSTITVPQLMLSKMLNLPVEYPIKTKDVKHLFPSLPNCYKVDLAIPELKIAIEVDGQTHKLKKWKYLDKRKTEVLNALGWSVLRFWNQEVLTETQAVLDKIDQYSHIRVNEMPQTE